MLRSDFIWNEDAIPQESSAAIRKVPMSVWDPIGVDGILEAESEYDDYIPRVHHLLSTNASVSQIQDYLFEVVSLRMGLSPPATVEHMLPAAEALKMLITS